MLSVGQNAATGGWYFKGKGLWSPPGKIKQLHSQHALYSTGSPQCEQHARSSIGVTDFIWAPHQVDHMRSDAKLPLVMHFTALGSVPFWTSAAGLHLCREQNLPGNLQYYFSCLPRVHLWIMGVTQDRLIRSLHVSAKCGHSFSDIPNVRRQEWTLRGKIRRSLVEQIVFSSRAPVPKINRPEYWHTIPSADTAHSGTLMGEIVTRLGGHTTLTTGRKLHRVKSCCKVIKKYIMSVKWAC